jgi:hypothetical protein
VWVHPACAKNLEGVREMLAPPEHLRFRRVESYDLGQHEEDLTLLLHAWPDIEEALLRQADDEGASNYRRDQAGALAAALRRAFRVEVQLVEGMLLERELGYVVLFDVNDYDARQGAATLREQRSTLDSLVYKHAQTQGSRPVVGVQIVPSGKPIGGEVCPRVMVTPKSTADLRDLPEPEPPATSVPLVTRGLHKLTPIEAPIYDVLKRRTLCSRSSRVCRATAPTDRTSSSSTAVAASWSNSTGTGLQVARATLARLRAAALVREEGHPRCPLHRRPIRGPRPVLGNRARRTVPMNANVQPHERRRSCDSAAVGQERSCSCRISVGALLRPHEHRGAGRTRLGDAGRRHLGRGSGGGGSAAGDHRRAGRGGRGDLRRVADIEQMPLGQSGFSVTRCPPAAEQLTEAGLSPEVAQEMQEWMDALIDAVPGLVDKRVSRTRAE